MLCQRKLEYRFERTQSKQYISRGSGVPRAVAQPFVVQGGGQSRRSKRSVIVSLPVKNGACAGVSESPREAAGDWPPSERGYEESILLGSLT